MSFASQLTWRSSREANVAMVAALSNLAGSPRRSLRENERNAKLESAAARRAAGADRGTKFYSL